MPKPPNSLRSVVIPAAGLGTRLRPLSLGCPKELLPLGDYPALTACLLEAEAAGLARRRGEQPGKPGLRSCTARSLPKREQHRRGTRRRAATWQRCGGVSGCALSNSRSRWGAGRRRARHRRAAAPAHRWTPDGGRGAVPRPLAPAGSDGAGRAGRGLPGDRTGGVRAASGRAGGSAGLNAGCPACIAV